MARRLMLDTGVIVAAERRKLDLHALVGDGDPAIAAITAMELLAGAEQSKANPQGDLIALNVEALLAVMPIEGYTLDVARSHALLAVHARRQGRPRQSPDLIIAATAAATGRTLVTTDAKAGFDELPGVGVELVHTA